MMNLALLKMKFILSGNVILLIAAENKEIAREAEKLIEIQYEPLEAILDLETAILKENQLTTTTKNRMRRHFCSFQSHAIILLKVR